MNIWTGNISAASTITSLTLDGTEGVFQLSVKAYGGTILISGAAAFKNGSNIVASSPIYLLDGESIVLSAQANSPITGLTINPNGYAAEVMLFF
jgi:hypothetical protein